jgi:predicted glycoside hydrolase/deacetylase ChbG (UPF0249 family)
MKQLIVNADDFGAGHGVNRGVVEAHVHGIVTSASLMVTMPAAAQAAALARAHPRLGIGLHVVLTAEEGDLRVDPARPDDCRREIRAQLARFEQLLGARPTHLDSHHNVHRHPLLTALFVEAAAALALPLREHSAVRYFPSFYGQWDGQTHPEQIDADSLERMLREEVRDGITELACHPGYVEPDFSSSYVIEREMELRTLCDRRVMDLVVAQGIHLTNYAELGAAARHVDDRRLDA